MQIPKERSGFFLRITGSTTFLVVPGGTVLLTTMTGYSAWDSASSSAIVSAATVMYERLAEPSGFGGVPTAMKMTSLVCTGVYCVVARRFAEIWVLRSVSNPSS